MAVNLNYDICTGFKVEIKSRSLRKWQWNPVHLTTCWRHIIYISHISWQSGGGGILWAHSVLPSVSRAEPWWGLQKNMKKCDRSAFCDLYLQTIFLIISIVDYISVITYLSTPQLLCLLCLFYWITESWIVWPIS